MKNVRYLYVNIQWQSLYTKTNKKNLYNLKANILDNGSDKPKYKDNRLATEIIEIVAKIWPRQESAISRNRRKGEVCARWPRRA